VRRGFGRRGFGRACPAGAVEGNAGAIAEGHCRAPPLLLAREQPTVPARAPRAVTPAPHRAAPPRMRRGTTPRDCLEARGGPWPHNFYSPCRNPPLSLHVGILLSLSMSESSSLSPGSGRRKYRQGALGEARGTRGGGRGGVDQGARRSSSWGRHESRTWRFPRYACTCSAAAPPTPSPPRPACPPLPPRAPPLGAARCPGASTCKTLRRLATRQGRSTGQGLKGRGARESDLVVSRGSERTVGTRVGATAGGGRGTRTL
jgi:hypothetical protein